MRYHYAYQSSGHPILTWKHGPPVQTRAAPGSLGNYVLPRAGAPEPINGLGACCSGCAGKPMGDDQPSGAELSTSYIFYPADIFLNEVGLDRAHRTMSLRLATTAGIAYTAYKLLKHLTK